MNRSLRFLMGVGIVAILTPAMAMVLPNNVTGLISWHTDASTPPGPSPALAAVDRDIQLAENSDPTTLQTPSSQVVPPTNEVDLLAEASTSTKAEQSSASTTTADNDHSADHDSNSGNEGNSSSGSQDPTSTTETSNPPTSSTTSTPSRNTSGTITGQACPCTVTETVELRGKVSLQGDLVVEGGTLVARPGVNVDGNGYQIMFMNGGKADFQGSKVFTWSDRGAKQNLQRDIVFKNMRRIIWMNNGGASTLKYFTVSDSGTSSLGDYPLHWHLNGNSTRGTIVEGVVVVNGKNHAYVPHGSHGITFRDAIARNTTGTAIWWDPPATNCTKHLDRLCTLNNSNDTVFDHILVDGVRSGSDSKSGFHTTTGFKLQAGSGNVVRNSVVINVSGGKNCSGFQWPSSANRNAGGTIWTFRNNFSQSKNCHGIFVWQNEGDRHHVIDGFSGGGINHGAYTNNYEYRNIRVPYVDVKAGGWSITTEGNIGTLTLKSPGKISPNSPTLKISDVNVGKLVVDNQASHALDGPPTYHFFNIGISCDDIQYNTVQSGTSILIDNRDCETP